VYSRSVVVNRIVNCLGDSTSWADAVIWWKFRIVCWPTCYVRGRTGAYRHRCWIHQPSWERNSGCAVKHTLRSRSKCCLRWLLA